MILTTLSIMAVPRRNGIKKRVQTTPCIILNSFMGGGTVMKFGCGVAGDMRPAIVPAEVMLGYAPVPGEVALISPATPVRSDIPGPRYRA